MAQAGYALSLGRHGQPAFVFLGYSVCTCRHRGSFQL